MNVAKATFIFIPGSDPRWSLPSPFIEEIRGGQVMEQDYQSNVVTNVVFSIRPAAVQFRQPINGTARLPWSEETEVQHGWSDIRAKSKPMGVQEETSHAEGEG